MSSVPKPSYRLTLGESRAKGEASKKVDENVLFNLWWD